MCDCIKRIEKEIREKFHELCHECGDVKTIEAHFENLYFDTEDNWKTKFSLPIKVEYQRKTKKGAIQTRHKTLDMQAKYCPFCGKPYKEENGNE
ncbi:hypothetical protein [Clostridium hydrogenum]|uniref:hypothetical protein n=1 Tax=Clostridium hydrogenum TaxID=2855764 RepID=UPI001F3A27A9|nr:hypothetical protein [Clostridium hydrogenum]